MDQSSNSHNEKEPWNKGKLVGQKPPLKLKEIWAIRIRLQRISSGDDNKLWSNPKSNAINRIKQTLKTLLILGVNPVPTVTL